ncbi:hypothetical protein CFD26_103962 [Aspergillus turcosus]|uniref:Uncharacterized protein n=1 Tax=Aspergillus turcosus TaxID=1245748 RepID=A0A3R7F4H6_9EURO|nr:hypothetical protein CFD26_103962 [Aspergillus turcosus]
MAESGSPISDRSDSSDPPESPHQIIARRRNRLVNIIKQNDLAQLRQFIASCSPEAVIVPGSPYLEDTLFNAASYGSPEALRIILEVYTAAPDVVERFNPKFCLLLDACGAANIEVVRFILDCHDSPENQLPLGPVDLHQRDDSGDTPIIAAAASLMNFDKAADEVEDETEWIQDRIARGNQLIHLLLDRGCPATDVIPPLPNDLRPGGSQVQDSVLGLAVSRANAPLIQRLIDSGADIYLKHQHLHHGMVPFQLRSTKGHVYDVTTLHLASFFYNPDAVKLLLDHQDCKNNTNPDLPSSRDSDGRLPLHWAASGPGAFNCRLLDKQLRITETIRLLLDHDSTGVNLVDNTGSTPLHYAAISHTMCSYSQHAELAIRTLLEYGADPRIPDGSGRTVLHLLGYHSTQCEPIETTLLDIILSHGANINHAENNGKTPLHVFAQNLRQVSAAKFLIERGADFRARNTLRETPFHAAARGIFNDHVRRDLRDEEVTTATKIRLQDEIMRALQEAAGEDTAVSLWQSLTFWKALAIGFALLNLKTLPLVWHIRVYRYFFQNGYLLTPAVKQSPKPSTDLLKPKSIFTRAPIMEIDMNMHKSNSTYFSDLDVSRTALMCSLVIKGSALLEKRLQKQGKRGPLHFVLGGVYTSFKREIPAYMKYEVQSHIASYDSKWIYIVTYFLTPRTGKKASADSDEVRRKRLLAVSISKYVLKKGRYTVPPSDAFEAAGYAPLIAPAANGTVNGSLTQRKEVKSGRAWDDNSEWQQLQKEILKGKEMVQPFVDQEEKLLDDYMEKMKLPAFA